ncbi:hypothetical protein ABZT06_20465 [Streptomyces sp. NPDC005483]|uniref:hypothetical protein n=1 Tax=Streptomyces sp. NPDC005483 TaxID=3154882 RepID=UPI0033A43F70
MIFMLGPPQDLVGAGDEGGRAAVAVIASVSNVAVCCHNDWSALGRGSLLFGAVVDDQQPGWVGSFGRAQIAAGGSDGGEFVITCAANGHRPA